MSDLGAAAELLRSLAHPVRLAIVLELGRGPRCVHELVDTLDAPQPLVSQHLRILRSAHLIVGERRGREVEYSLADDHVRHIVIDAVGHASEPTGTARDPHLDHVAGTHDPAPPAAIPARSPIPTSTLERT